MALDEIQTLINKQDNVEIIRDQIAAILALEERNQRGRAKEDGKVGDPENWRLNVYTERSNPWEQYLNLPKNPAPEQTAPIVNVWFDNSRFEGNSSNIVERQKSETIYNIDCYGYGTSEDDPNGGHKAGDRVAAFEMQRALRLVRNILMASQNTYLQLRGLVWNRWPQSISSFQPEIEGRAVEHVVAGRIAFRVGFNEFSPQVEGPELELLSIDIERLSDGKLLAEVDCVYPL